MLSVRQLVTLGFLFRRTFSASAQHTTAANPISVAAKARVVQEEYCRADADVFTVSLKLRIEVTNSSDSPVKLLWPMVPVGWQGRSQCKRR